MPKSVVLVLVCSALAVSACDDVPSAPEEGERLRVALVTAREPTDVGDRWVVFEIDEEGTVEPVVESTTPIPVARYTSEFGTSGGVAYLNADHDVRIRDLGSGAESAEEGPMERFRFSRDGVQIAFTREVPSDNGEEVEQVFVLNRSTDQLFQITHNECETNDPPEPCAWSSARPVFGDNDELYMIRRLRDASGEGFTSLSVVSGELVEARYLVVPADSQEIYPTSFFEGVLLAGYEGQEEGYYALVARTGLRVATPSALQHPTYCHDATIAGEQDGVLRFIDVSGEEVHQVSLPMAAGSDVLSVDCSRRPRIIHR